MWPLSNSESPFKGYHHYQTIYQKANSFLAMSDHDAPLSKHPKFIITEKETLSFQSFSASHNLNLTPPLNFTAKTMPSEEIQLSKSLKQLRVEA